MNVPMRLTGTASVGINVARNAEEEKDDEHHENERLDQGLLYLVDRILDEHRRVVGDLPGHVLGKPLLRSADTTCLRLLQRC